MEGIVPAEARTPAAHETFDGNVHQAVWIDEVLHDQPSVAHFRALQDDADG